MGYGNILSFRGHRFWFHIFHRTISFRSVHNTNARLEMIDELAVCNLLLLFQNEIANLERTIEKNERDINNEKSLQELLQNEGCKG